MKVFNQAYKMSAQRIEYMDIAKGFGILWVIAGHTWPWPSMPCEIANSFHMPLFFIISGYFIKKTPVIKIMRRLLKPYF